MKIPPPKRVLIIQKYSSIEYQTKFSDTGHQSEVAAIEIADYAKLLECHIKQMESNEQLKQGLSKLGIEYEVIPGHSEKHIPPVCPSCQKLAKGHNYDIVISAGGDGTTLFSAWHLLDTPLLVFKNDSLSKGALASLSREDILEKLGRLSKGEFTFSKWTRVEVLHYPFGKSEPIIYRGLNEAILGGKGLRIDKTSRYTLYQNGEEEHQVNSGIMITTGTGTTGWPHLFSPQSRENSFLYFKTLFPMKGIRNEGIISEDSPLVLRSEMHNQCGTLSLDSQDEPVKINRGDRFHIQISKYPLIVIRFE